MHGKITSINYGIYMGLTLIVRHIHTTEPSVLCLLLLRMDFYGRVHKVYSARYWPNSGRYIQADDKAF
jgi:hypothetical protein